MKRMTLSEANQNFSKIAKMVDEEGAVTLTKFDNDKYVVCLASYYQDGTTLKQRLIKEFREGLYAKYTGLPSVEGIAKIKTDSDITTIYMLEEVEYEDGSDKSYIYYEMPVPSDKLFISETKPAKITFDFRDVFLKRNDEFIYIDTLRDTSAKSMKKINNLIEDFKNKSLKNIVIEF